MLPYLEEIKAGEFLFSIFLFFVFFLFVFLNVISRWDDFVRNARGAAQSDVKLSNNVCE